MTDQVPTILDRAEIATSRHLSYAVPALTAAAHAERAAAFLHGLQPKAETPIHSLCGLHRIVRCQRTKLQCAKCSATAARWFSDALGLASRGRLQISRD